MADLPVPTSSAEEVRRIADSVLARPEFAEAQPSLWDRFLRWLNDVLGRVFTAIGSGGRGSIIGTLTLLALAALAVYLVVRLTRSVRADPARDLALDIGIGRSPREWLAEAQQHEASGRWRDAVRCRYRALLAQLSAAGLLDEVAGRTSGEYLATVREDLPTAAEPFTEVTRRFEAAWYGHDPTSSEDVAAFTAAAARTETAAGIRRPLTVGSA